MILTNLLKDLTYGEFAQLNLGNFKPEEYEADFDPHNIEQALSYVNQGLNKLYSRFLLSAKEVYIQQYEEIATYYLDSKYAESNLASAEPIKYIADSASNPFQDDVLKIEEVYDEEGNKLFLNDASEDLSIFTPSYKSLQIPWPNDFNQIAVQYRASHPRLTYTYGMDTDATEVDIPESLYQALLAYVGYKAFGSQDEQTGMAHLQMYENCCQQVERHGLYIQPDWNIDRFDRNGWC